MNMLDLYQNISSFDENNSNGAENYWLIWKRKMLVIQLTSSASPLSTRWMVPSLCLLTDWCHHNDLVEYIRWNSSGSALKGISFMETLCFNFSAFFYHQNIQAIFFSLSTFIFPLSHIWMKMGMFKEVLSFFQGTDEKTFPYPIYKST